MSDFAEIKLLVIDVDGTMTDGGIYYDASGNEIKKFNTKDAAGIFAARCAGIKTMVLTGRKSFAVEKRMKELKIDYVYQGISDKKCFLSKFMINNGLRKECIGYIGDDLNDWEPMQLAGVVVVQEMRATKLSKFQTMLLKRLEDMVQCESALHIY